MDRVADLSAIAQELKRVGAAYGCAVACVNQVSTREHRAALGNTWHHAVNVRLRVGGDHEDNAFVPRVVRVEKSATASDAVAARFVVSSRGVEEIPSVMF